MKQKKQTRILHNLIRKVLPFFLMMAVALAAFPTSSFAAEGQWPSDPDTVGPSMIVMDADTGTILYQKNADQQLYPASITKIMTALVALENCKDLGETVTFSEEAVYNTYGSSIARDVGEQMTMEQCLYAMMLASANECAYAIAEHVGGSLDNFVAMMNQKAQELGCTGTHFNNSCGLPDPDHYTTAHDMALIARAAWQNPEFRTLCGTGTYTIPATNKHSEETLLQNHHLMLFPYQGVQDYLESYCLGGKTGYTDEAQYTLVTYGQKNGMTLITVVMNESDKADQYTDTNSLMTYFFDNFKDWKLKDYETNLGGGGDSFFDTDAGVFLPDDRLYHLEDTDADVILPNGVDFSEADRSFSLSAADGTTGTVNYTYDGRDVGNATISLNTSAADAATKVVDQISQYSAANQAEEDAQQPTTTKGKIAKFFSKVKDGLKEIWWGIQDYGAMLVSMVKDFEKGDIILQDILVLAGTAFVVGFLVSLGVHHSHKKRRRQRKEKDGKKPQQKKRRKND